MSRSDPIISASLVVALAAGAAGVFTVATATSSDDQTTYVDRTFASNHIDRGLNSIIFDAKPIAGGTTEVQPAEPKSSVVGEQQLMPEPTADRQEGTPIKNGCESGLSPDISPTVALAPGRCLTELSSPKFASLR